MKKNHYKCPLLICLFLTAINTSYGSDSSENALSRNYSSGSYKVQSGTQEEIDNRNHYLLISAQHAGLSKCQRVDRWYIPTEIDPWKYLLLTRLDISKNKLSAFPENFTQLITITQLNISQNLIAHLPEDFVQLEFLKVLDASDNNFEVFPNTILGNTRLTSLNFGCNNIMKIPSAIASLTNLRRLYFEDNKPATAESEFQYFLTSHATWRLPKLRAVYTPTHQMGRKEMKNIRRQLRYSDEQAQMQENKETNTCT